MKANAFSLDHQELLSQFKLASPSFPNLPEQPYFHSGLPSSSPPVLHRLWSLAGTLISKTAAFCPSLKPYQTGSSPNPGGPGKLLPDQRFPVQSINNKSKTKLKDSLQSDMFGGVGLKGDPQMSRPQNLRM